MVGALLAGTVLRYLCYCCRLCNKVVHSLARKREPSCGSHVTNTYRLRIPYEPCTHRTVRSRPKPIQVKLESHLLHRPTAKQTHKPNTQRFAEEIEVLRSKHGELDQDALIVKLLVEEFSFTTVEASDLPTLKMQPRDKDKVYLLGETHFAQKPPSACVELTNLNTKVK